MNETLQTNLDDISLEEIKTDTLKSDQSRKSRVIHFASGDSIEVDENDNCIIRSTDRDAKGRKIGVRNKRLKLFQLISSPIDQFLSNNLGNIGKKTVNISSNVGKKTLKHVDSFGGTIANFIGITDPKFRNEIDSSKARTTASLGV